MHVRYLDVALDAGPVTRRVLIPIGKVWINDALDQVVIGDTSYLDALPDYDPGSFSRDFQHRVLAGFGEIGGGGADFYSAPAFDRTASSFGSPTPRPTSEREVAARAPHAPTRRG